MSDPLPFLTHVHRWRSRLEAMGRTDARRATLDLASSVLGCHPLEVPLQHPTTAQIATIEPLIALAEDGEPVAYLLGWTPFRDLVIRCDRRALIPRPETEWLVEAALEFLRGRPDTGTAPVRIVDVGTGTGCVALSLLDEWPTARAWAIDRSADALSLAAENARVCGLADRIRFLQGDLLAPLRTDECIEQGVDLITANLPYIPSGECATLESSVRDHEPLAALDGGKDGLVLIRRLIEQAPALLRTDGALFLEIGHDQGAAVTTLRADSGWHDISVRPDLAGHDRIVSARQVRIGIACVDAMGPERAEALAKRI